MLNTSSPRQQIYTVVSYTAKSIKGFLTSHHILNVLNLLLLMNLIFIFLFNLFLLTVIQLHLKPLSNKV